MDATYRYQRWIYDATRKYFLFGRDHLIRNLKPPAGGTVLEIGCGTGRNLALIRRRHPDCQLFGLDISSEMLRSARAKLGTDAILAAGDACTFDPESLFGRTTFDRVFLSYATSMIPDWVEALRAGARATAPGGSLQVVDFGLQEGYPAWFRAGFRAWLARFHVEPRQDLASAIRSIAKEAGMRAEWNSLHRGYAQYAVLSRPR